MIDCDKNIYDNMTAFPATTNKTDSSNKISNCKKLKKKKMF